MLSNMTKTFFGYDKEWNMEECKISPVLQKIDGIDIWRVKCKARHPNYYLSGPRYIEMGLNKDLRLKT